MCDKISHIHSDLMKIYVTKSMQTIHLTSTCMIYNLVIEMYYDTNKYKYNK